MCFFCGVDLNWEFFLILMTSRNIFVAARVYDQYIYIKKTHGGFFYVFLSKYVKVQYRTYLRPRHLSAESLLCCRRHQRRPKKFTSLFASRSPSVLTSVLFLSPLALPLIAPVQTCLRSTVSTRVR